jgi:hypothetical protein
MYSRTPMLTNCGPLARPLATMRAKTGLGDRDRLLAAGVSPELSRSLKPVVLRDDDDVRRADTHRLNKPDGFPWRRAFGYPPT